MYCPVGGVVFPRVDGLVNQRRVLSEEFILLPTYVTYVVFS